MSMPGMAYCLDMAYCLWYNPVSVWNRYLEQESESMIKSVVVSRQQSSVSHETLLEWALHLYLHSRKPHRAQPTHTTVSRDLARTLDLTAERHAIAIRYCNGREKATDESREIDIIAALESIAKSYAWEYVSTDGGLSASYVTLDGTQIQIPIIGA